jgi:DNA-binding Lrp family transcriptional regulator
VTIAKELGYTREWVNKMVRTLRKAGWLTPSGRKGPGGVIDYSLTLPDGQEMAAGNGGSSHNLYITTKSPLRGSVDSTTRGLKAPLTETAVRAVSKEESRKAARKAAYAEVVKSYGDMASPDYDWDRWEFAPNVSIEPPF